MKLEAYLKTENELPSNFVWFCRISSLLPQAIFTSTQMIVRLAALLLKMYTARFYATNDCVESTISLRKVTMVSVERPIFSKEFSSRTVLHPVGIQTFSAGTFDNSIDCSRCAGIM